VIEVADEELHALAVDVLEDTVGACEALYDARDAVTQALDEAVGERGLRRGGRRRRWRGRRPIAAAVATTVISAASAAATRGEAEDRDESEGNESEPSRRRSD
jgi:hypothetical protein